MASKHGPVPGVAIRMTFEGQRDTPLPGGEARLPGVHNYFLGNDAGRWRTHVPLYASVLYRRVYPGIDVRLRASEGHPEYDVLVEPDADLGQVSVRVEGAEGVRVSADGSLVMETPLGPVTQPVPRTWHSGPFDQRREVPCRFVLLGPDRFGFEVDNRDATSPLTIDPGLLWSTLLGGRQAQWVGGVAVDTSGEATVVGSTSSTTYPVTAGAFSMTSSPVDAFVSRLDPTKTGNAQLIYSTFLGGAQTDRARAVAVDPSGVVTLTGETFSAAFPTTPGSYDTTFNGRWDIFVCRLDPTRSGSGQLTYSTFVGGSSFDDPVALRVDAGGVVTVAGQTQSRKTFPTTPGSYDRTANGDYDLFVSRLDPTRIGRAQLTYSTFLGGSGLESLGGLSVGASGVITLTGWTTPRSAGSYPTTAGAYATTYRGGSYDAIVSCLDPRLSGTAQLTYSTFLGGSGTDSAWAVSVDADGVVTVGGSTSSAGFPRTAGAYAAAARGRYGDAFVSRLDPRRTGPAQLTYSTFLGGGQVHALSVEPGGLVTMAGSISSPVFPTTPGSYDRILNGSDAFLGRLDPRRTGRDQLLYSSFLGGSGDDHVWAMHVDASGVATVVGETTTTTGTSFPTTPGAYARSINGQRDVFVSRLDVLPAGASTFGTSSPGCTGPVLSTVSSWPRSGNGDFALICSNAPPAGSGVLMLGTGRPSRPIFALGVSLSVGITTPVLFLPVAAGPAGASEVRLPISRRPRLVGQSVYAQFVWFGPSSPAPCPPGAFSASNALAITIQQ